MWLWFFHKPTMSIIYITLFFIKENSIFLMMNRVIKYIFPSQPTLACYNAKEIKQKSLYPCLWPVKDTIFIQITSSLTAETILVYYIQFPKTVCGCGVAISAHYTEKPMALTTHINHCFQTMHSKTCRQNQATKPTEMQIWKVPLALNYPCQNLLSFSIPRNSFGTQLSFYLRN